MRVHALRWLFTSWMAVGLVTAALGQAPPVALPTTDGPILVDPLLVGQVDQVWKLIANPRNPVWPGWDAKNTPILIYFPNRQDLLINHPKPPEGFKRYTGPVKSAIGPIYLRDGRGVTTLDGQNTAVDVNGVKTLMVADTLSARRQTLQGIIGAAKGDPDGAAKQIESLVTPNPIPMILMFAHEAFHVYQHGRASSKMPSESALGLYPALSVENNVGLALEAEFLVAALEAKTRQEAVPHLEKWLAARTARRKSLPKAAVDYEDATEFSEGTAKYVEYRMTQCLEAVEPLDGMWLVQGFQGFKDLSAERANMRKMMKRMMSGEVAVNNDPYGASPVRFRLYFSGMALGAALDVLGVSWHEKIFEPNVTLTSLLEANLAVPPKQLEADAKNMRAGERHAELVKQKKKLEEEGNAYVATVLAEFETAPGSLTIDYSGLGTPKVGLVYTSFGILRVTDHQTVHRLIPVSGSIGAFQFAEDSARPVMHDTQAKQFRLRLTGKPDAADLGKQLGAAFTSGQRVVLAELKLPGVTLKGVKGMLKLDGARATLVLGE